MKAQATPFASASCYCRAVRLVASAHAKSIVHCHCGQCRRLSGAAFSTWVSFLREAIFIHNVKGLVAFAASSNVTRHFCKVCGSHVFTSDERLPKMVDVPAGVIDEGVALAPKAHCFINHRATWHEIGDALPQFEGESGRLTPSTTVEQVRGGRTASGREGIMPILPAANTEKKH